VRVRFVSGESFGTRSMATYVETGDVKIFIDPGAALAPRRYGLPPHPKELEKLESDWKRIAEYASACDVVVVTHYHRDHFSAVRHVDRVYRGKTVLLKSVESSINPSQRARGKALLSRIGDLASRVEFADGRRFTFGDTILEFSRPLPHGVDDRLGYVLEVHITDGRRSFVFTSDVEGPSLDEHLRFIIEREPDIVYVDGPATYLAGAKYPEDAVEAAVENLLRIVEEVESLKVLVVDHHLTRDINWEARIARVIEACRDRKVWIGTAAEYMGERPMFLEANRRALYAESCDAAPGGKGGNG